MGLEAKMIKGLESLNIQRKVEDRKVLCLTKARNQSFPPEEWNKKKKSVLQCNGLRKWLKICLNVDMSEIRIALTLVFGKHKRCGLDASIGDSLVQAWTYPCPRAGRWMKWPLSTPPSPTLLSSYACWTSTLAALDLPFQVSGGVNCLKENR